jgi:hypothetical protein
MDKIYEVDETSQISDYYDRTHTQTFSHKGLHYVFYINDDYQLLCSVYNNTLIGRDKVADKILSYADFSLVQQGDDVYIVYAVLDGIKFVLHFMKGNITQNNITWKEPVILGEGDRPFINLHEGKPVLVYLKRREKSFKWIIAEDINGSKKKKKRQLINWTSVDKDFFPAVYSLGENGLLFIYWHGATDRIFSNIYKDGVLSEVSQLFNCFDYPMEYQYFYYCWDTVVVNETLVYFLTPSGQVLSWQLNEDEWKKDKPIMSKSRESAIGLSVDREKDIIYLLSLIKESGDFGFYKRNETGWSEFNNLTRITNFKISGNCNDELDNGSLGIRWFEEKGKNMKIKLGIMNLKKSNEKLTSNIDDEIIISNNKQYLLMFSILIFLGLIVIIFQNMKKLNIF